jgi:hypothetical protein
VEPEAPPESQPVAVASVVRGLGGGGSVRVTVHGTWRGAPAGTPPVLIVDDGDQRHVVPALAPRPAGDPSTFHAAFDLPPALGEVSGDGLLLSVAEAEIRLPAALPSVPQAPVRDVAAEAPPVPAEVIDRAVLAEHRTRRAEQGLEDLAERTRALEAHLAEVTAERDRLREELEDAEAAEERRSAGTQEQLARLRESAAQAEGLQAALRTARGDADAAVGDLHAAREEVASLRRELEAVREERDGLREAVARADRDGTTELGEIAKALRDQAEEQGREQDRPAAADDAEDPFDVALAQLRARTLPPGGEEGGNVIPFDPMRNTMNLAAMSPGRRARSRLRRVAPEDRKVLQGDSLGPERRSGVAWLAGAIDLLAAEDIRAAGAFLVSLLPDGARTLAETLVYDIDLDGVGAYRVGLREGAGEVTPLGENAPGEPAFRVSGPVAALATLGAGGAPRRLGGAVRVHGSRRALRRLLKSRRVPVDLGDLATGGVVPEPALLLQALAVAVRPTWTGDSDFAVAVDVPEREPITVVAEPGKRLQVVGAPPLGGAVRAVLTTSPAALLALLGRVAPPDDDDAWLSGEEDVMSTLLELLDRAQGLPSRY